MASTLPGLALAQDFSGAATLGYGLSSVDGTSDDLTSLTLDGRFVYDAGNGLTFGGDLSVARVDVDGVSENLTGSAYGVDVAYRLQNGLSLGAYLERAEIDVSGLGDIAATSFGIEAGYGVGQADIRVFAGRTDTSPELPPGIDVRDLGVTATYAISDRLSLGAALVNTEISGFGDSVDLRFVGVAGAYSLNDQWSFFGGITETSVGVLDADVRTMGLGLSYDMSQLVNFGSVASLELARTRGSVSGFGSADVDTIRLGLTIPLGSGDADVPLNSVADTVFNPRRNALSQGVLAAF
ncbi:MAG TPA: hypothetical protein VLA78_14970 [Paracoccaceae bacterium]|nr:hypothetical protein [Paracoccaceae bacterium]